MQKHKYPDHAQGAAVRDHRTSKSLKEPEADLHFEEDLYESGAYTNGMLGI